MGNILAKATGLRITLNSDGTPIVSKSHSPITLVNLSCFNLGGDPFFTVKTSLIDERVPRVMGECVIVKLQVQKKGGGSVSSECLFGLGKPTRNDINLDMLI